jgi:hypothetical protein
VTNRPPHSALREWRDGLAQPVVWAVFAGVAAALAILAPFGTDAHLRLAGRFAYWLAVVAATYGAGFLVALLLWPLLDGRLPRAGVVLVLGLATGLAILPIMVLLNLLAFGHWPQARDWPGLVARLMALAMIISTVIQLLAGHLARAPRSGPPDAAGQPALLSRLPVNRRAPLLALSAEDHYTRVRTAAGDTLVLIRLSDAIRETPPVAGLQVHRSHWVALGAVTDLRKQGDGAVIIVRGGAEIPVSRRYMPDIRAAGLLPG